MKTLCTVVCGILPCAMVLTGCFSTKPKEVVKEVTKEVVVQDVKRENDIILRETKNVQNEIATLIEKKDFAAARKRLCEAKLHGIANVDKALASVHYELLVRVVDEEGKAIKVRMIGAAEGVKKTDSLKVCEDAWEFLKAIGDEPIAPVALPQGMQALDKAASPNLEAKHRAMNVGIVQLRNVLVMDVEKRIEPQRFKAALAVARKTGVDFAQELVWTESSFAPGGRVEPVATKRLRAEYAYLVRMLKDGLVLDGNQKTNLLVGAVASGRDAVAKWCLSDLKVSIDAISALDGMKRTPLLWALSGSDAETLELVWKASPNLHLVDSNGDSALHYAVRRGDARDISLALAKHLVNRPNALGRTPIYDSIDTGDVAAARKLLEAGAKLDLDAAVCKKSGAERMTPFAYACSRAACLDMIELLHAKGAVFGERDFALAICSGSLPIAQWFVEKQHCNVNSDALKGALDARIAAYRSCVSKKTLDAKKASELTDGQVCALLLKKPVRDYLVRRGCVILP